MITKSLQERAEALLIKNGLTFLKGLTQKEKEYYFNESCELSTQEQFKMILEDIETEANLR